MEAWINNGNINEPQRAATLSCTCFLVIHGCDSARGSSRYCFRLRHAPAVDRCMHACTQVLGDGSLAALLGADVIAPYRMAYGRVAASCAVLGEALAASTEKRLHSCGRAVVGSLA